MAGGERFRDTVAVVVGGASGIGAAVVVQLVAEGCTAVHIADIDGVSASAVPVSNPRAHYAEVDVRDAGTVDSFFADVLAAEGRIDIVVHAAGVDDPRAKAAMHEAREAGAPLDIFRTLDHDQWSRVMRINLDGTFHVLQAAVRAMHPARSGAIVVIGSSAAFDTLAGYGHYAASKAGVHALAQSVAKEVAGLGIRVNVIAPGPVDTPMAARTPDSVRKQMAASGAIGYASAEELAANILFLASPASSNVVGAVLLSNGGRFTV